MRLARDEDLARIAEVHVASWKAGYRGMIDDAILDSISADGRVVAWRGWFQEPRSELWVAELDGDIAGFARLSAAPRTPTATECAEVTHLYLDPPAYGTGIGNPLFERVLESARERSFAGVVLWVLEENARARKFYERHGFRLDGGRQARPRWLGENVHEVRYEYRF